MADQFSLSGLYSTQPLGGDPSFAPVIEAPINEPVVLAHKHYDDVDLSTDATTPLNFGGGVVNAHVVILKAVGGKVRARVTSADGSVQAIPFDTYLLLMSMTVPITAIDLTRVPSQATSVRVFLGEKQ